MIFSLTDDASDSYFYGLGIQSCEHVSAYSDTRSNFGFLLLRGDGRDEVVGGWEATLSIVAGAAVRLSSTVISKK